MKIFQKQKILSKKQIFGGYTFLRQFLIQSLLFVMFNVGKMFSSLTNEVNFKNVSFNSLER